MMGGKKSLMCIGVAVLLVSFVAVSSASATYGSYVSGLYKDFEIADSAQTEINVTAGIEFDPTSQVGGIYNRIYLVNRSGANDKRGLYSVDIATETSSSRLALAGDGTNALDSPYDVTVDSAGNAYVVYAGTASVWKVANPSGSPVETQMLGSYGGEGDDDPATITMLPTGFGGSYTAGSDLLLGDNGINDNANEGIGVVSAASTSASPDITNLWSDVGDPEFSIRLASSNVDGYVYFAHNSTLPTADLGGSTMAFVNRLNSSGTLERIYLNIDASEIPSLDDAVAINQTDGSLWIVVDNGGTRNVYRIDVANATLQSGNDYLADITLEIGDIGYNIGTNSMAISPDGELLAIGASDGVDKLYVYSIVPEPATIVLFAAGFVFASRRKHK